jgi:hypothetical protein
MFGVFNECVADSQKPRGVNPKYWVTAMPCGISFEIWPIEKGHNLTSLSQWSVIKAGFFRPELFTHFRPACHSH